MCNCIQTVKEKMRELYPDAESISFENQELLSGKLYSTLEIRVPGKKKSNRELLLHTYCPICGQPYEKVSV